MHSYMQLAGWQMVPVVLKKNGFTCAELAKRLCSFLITSGVLSNCIILYELYCYFICVLSDV